MEPLAEATTEIMLRSAIIGGAAYVGLDAWTAFGTAVTQAGLECRPGTGESMRNPGVGGPREHPPPARRLQAGESINTWLAIRVRMGSKSSSCSLPCSDVRNLHSLMRRLPISRHDIASRSTKLE